jgi:hypothetical protein
MRFIIGIGLGFMFGVIYSANALLSESGFVKTILEVLLK